MQAFLKLMSDEDNAFPGVSREGNHKKKQGTGGVLLLTE